MKEIIRIIKRWGCALLLMLTLCACGQAKTDKTVVILQETAPPTAPPETAALSSKAARKAAASSLPAEWYGWWKMDHTSGDWAKMYGYYWDCCAEMNLRGGVLSLLLWDEDMPREDCLASAQLEEKDGALRCISGSFLDRELTQDDWTVTRGEDAAGLLWQIEGEYKAVGKGGFHYVIYLRPWGSRWPGSEDEKPYYYESWYLPLIEAGESMPDRIGKQEEKNS